MKTFTKRSALTRLTSFLSPLWGAGGLLLLMGGRAVAQTSYTWNGNTSSAWGTSTNWTPNGVPSSSDYIVIQTGTNALKLTSDKTIERYRINSGTMDLDGYTLTVNDQLLMYGGVTTAGKIVQNATNYTYINNATVNCKLNLVATTVTIRYSNMADSVKVKQTTTSGTIFWRGNRFFKHLDIENTSNGNMNIGNNPADSCFDGLTMTGRRIRFGYQHQGSYVLGDIVMNATGPSGTSMSVSSGGFGPSVYVDGNIILNKSGTGSCGFASVAGASSLTMTSGHSIIEGDAGFTEGEIIIKGLNQLDTGGGVYLNSGADAQILTMGPVDTRPNIGVLDIDLDVVNIDGAVVNGTANVTAVELALTNNTFHAPTTVTHTGSATSYNGGNVFNAPLSVVSSISSSSTLWSYTASDTANSSVNLSILNGGNLVMGFSHDFLLRGSLYCNQQSGNILLGDQWGGGVKIDGVGTQHLKLELGNSILSRNVIIDKPSGRLFLHDLMDVDQQQLTLTKGVLEVMEGGLVSIRDGATATGASDASFVQGPVKKIGNDAFTFPVGKNGHYRPIVISAPSSASDAFTAEYFDESAHQYYNLAERESTFGGIGNLEYWSLSRNVGSSNVNVSLSWNSATSCIVDTLSNLKIASWNDTIWKDLGNGGTTGNSDDGTIVTASTVGHYDIFTLGSVNPLTCIHYQPFECGTGEFSSGSGSSRGADCIPNDVDYLNKYRNPGYWVENFAAQPVKTIKVNFIICQDDNGGNAFIDDPIVHDQFQLLIDHLNTSYSNSEAKGYTLTCEPSYTHVVDSKIRFEMNEVIFLRNSTFNSIGNNQSGGCEYNSGGPILEHVLANYAGSDKVLNHIFTQPSGPTCWQGYYENYNSPTYGTIGYVHTVRRMFDPYDVLQEDGGITEFGFIHYHSKHEYGHALGLHHTYNAERLNTTNYDYLNDVFGDCGEVDGSGNCLCGSMVPPQTDWSCYLEADCFFGELDQPTPLMSGGWDCDYISPKSIGRMHRALSMYNQTFVINNRPMHQYVKEQFSYSLPKEITEDETWDFGIKMYQDIIVKTDNTLTIKCEVRMPIDGKIVVEPGAKLVVDGGVLTSAHDYGMWQGVQVHGNRYENQGWPTSTYQGIVELKNDAVIEQARVGIDVIDLADIANSGGGIVKAEDATFLNCRKAVAFGPFSKHTNLSQFKEVTFLTNAPLNDPAYGGVGTPEFVSLWEVYGVDFIDCTFEFDKDNPAFTFTIPPSNWPTAITSHYAGYNLLKGTGSGNQFTNLLNGMYSRNFFGIKHRVHSQYSNFDNVYRSSTITASYYPTLLANTFTIPDFETGIAPYGCYGHYNFAYRVKDNIFSSVEPTPTSNWGAVIRGTLATATSTGGLVSGENEFNNVVIGTQTELNNTYLDITCNAYDGNDFDWILNPMSEGYLGYQGSACPQSQGGTDGERAGNTFENTTNDNIYEGNLLDYSKYFAAGGTGPANANTVPTSASSNFNVIVDNCLMTVEDPSCVAPCTTPPCWDSERQASQTSWFGKLDDLETLETNIDGGETQLMLDTIADGTTNDNNLKSVLLAHSPLSDTVIDAYILRSGVAEGNFVKVMVYNMPVSHSVWENMQTKLNGFRSEKNKIKLRAAQIDNTSIETATSLKREIRFYEGRTYANADEVVNYYIDTDSLTEAITYMDTVGLPAHRLALLGTHIGDGNWDLADTSLALLPLKTVNDTALYDLYALWIDLGRDSLTILSMSSSDSTRVQAIASDTTLDASVLAKGMLGILLDTLYTRDPEPFTLPSSKYASEEPEWEVAESPTEAEYFKAYPNPFSNSTTIEYNLGTECELGCELRLYDVQGRVILKETLYSESGKGQLTIDLSLYGSGIYYCSLYGNRQLLQTEKLILMQ